MITLTEDVHTDNLEMESEHNEQDIPQEQEINNNNHTAQINEQAALITALEEERTLLLKRIVQLESLHESYLAELDTLDQANKTAKIDTDNFLQSLVFPVNTIDQIAAAYRNTGEHALVVEQLETVSNMTVQNLEQHGIVEIPVYGKELDGTFMESFGVAAHASDPALPAYAAAIVMRRAFKHKKTDEILQQALVYTEPEEA